VEIGSRSASSDSRKPASIVLPKRLICRLPSLRSNVDATKVQVLADLAQVGLNFTVSQSIRQEGNPHVQVINDCTRSNFHLYRGSHHSVHLRLLVPLKVRFSKRARKCADGKSAGGSAKVGCSGTEHRPDQS
jgi:hypothetical protein